LFFLYFFLEELEEDVKEEDKEDEDEKDGEYDEDKDEDEDVKKEDEDEKDGENGVDKDEDEDFKEEQEVVKGKDEEPSSYITYFILLLTINFPEIAFALLAYIQNIFTFHIYINSIPSVYLFPSGPCFLEQKTEVMTKFLLD
jgi:archaellum component FlaD/FlaE